MKEKIERAIRWAFMIIGLLIIASCTTAGGSGIVSGELKDVLSGILGGVIVVGILFGWAYTYLSLQRDLKRIHEEIATLRAGAAARAE